MIGFRCALIFDILMRKLVPHFVPSCDFITILQKFYRDCFKIFPIMLALCLMLSMAYHAQNYAGIIGLGLHPATLGR